MTDSVLPAPGEPSANNPRLRMSPLIMALACVTGWSGLDNSTARPKDQPRAGTSRRRFLSASVMPSTNATSNITAPPPITTERKNTAALTASITSTTSIIKPTAFMSATTRAHTPRPPATWCTSQCSFDAFQRGPDRYMPRDMTA